MRTSLNVVLLASLMLVHGVAFAQIGSDWLVLNNFYVPAFTACYSGTDASESGGFLTLTQESGSFTCQSTTGVPYQVGGIVSSSFSFTYGVVRARIKFGSNGNTLWSAVWMEGGASGSSAYPPTCIATLLAGTGHPFQNCVSSAQTNYEIDIAEDGSNDNNITNSLLLWQSGSQIAGGQTITSSNFSPSSFGYHVYELDWYPNLLVFKIDGVVLSTMTKTVSVPEFLILDNETFNLPTSFPNTTSVDWIRVCSDPNAACNEGDATMIFDDEFNAGVTPPATVNNTKQGVTLQGIAAQ